MRLRPTCPGLPSLWRFREWGGRLRRTRSRPPYAPPPIAQVNLTMLRPVTLLVLTVAILVPPLRADDWPQWLGPKRDGVWREGGLVDKFPAGGPVVRWRAEIGPGYTGPAVAGGRVYVMDRQAK